MGMTSIDRRKLLALGAASAALPSAIQKAWAIDAKAPTGTIRDVEHVVVLMQENRSFDHYFGTMSGVRGFGDRFPVPLAGGRTVWAQAYSKGEPREIAPFPLNTQQTFAHMRVEGTPHSWFDAQYAWDNGRMASWPDHKQPHAMGHFEQADIPFQWALAEAFTICDAYHCSFMGGTNTNRLFLWSGTNDGQGAHGGPSISNSHDTMPEKGGAKQPYLWTTYCERLEAAGVSWKIYEDMADNFGDNPLVGFKAFRDSVAGVTGSNPALAAKGLSTQHLDVLKADVVAGKLPAVSWIISPAKDSEHPGPSSPAQGADYIARVLDALTANPDVWARTVFLINFDENDGFFDHVPPPAPPSVAGDVTHGASTVDTAGEYHLVRAESEKTAERDDLMGRAYGLGPRVPLYVISPFARGGWVNSEVFDHTSVIRFIEKRFDVLEPNISAWRRAVCGDLTSCFNFRTPNLEAASFPGTSVVAELAGELPGRTKPPTPSEVKAPVQAIGVRRSRALPYELAVVELETVGPLHLRFQNTGRAAAVFHVYDRLRLDAPPRRYTVEPGKLLDGEWPKGPYDICVYGPNGFFRSFAGSGSGTDVKRPLVQARIAPMIGGPINFTLGFEIPSRGVPDRIHVTPGAYAEAMLPKVLTPSPAGKPPLIEHRWSLMRTGGWYDFVLTREADAAWKRRYAGRAEIGTGALTSDPAMGGAATMSWT